MNLTTLINYLPIGNNSAEKGYFLYTKIPERFRRKFEENNFRGTIRFVGEHSAFYKRKFAEHKIDPKKINYPEDLGGFFTTAEDIRANPDEFVCLPPETAYESTGTTSKKTKRVYFSRNEVREAGWAGAVGLWGIGIRPEDRIASAFDYSFWVSGPVLVASCETLGCFHVEAGRIAPEEFYERLTDYKISVIVGDPSWLLALTQVAEKKGIWPLKLLIGGGENVTEETRRYIESVWKCDFLLSYGQTEAFGAIGMETRAKEGYQLNEFHNTFEIVDRDNEGYGELVYTTNNRRVMPLVRYKSGDITRFLKTPSKVGMPGERIDKLKGRVNEWVATAMGNIAPWMFEPVFGPLDEIGEDWQIELRKENLKDLIVLNVESMNGASDEKFLKEKVLTSLKTNLPDAWKLAEQGLFRFDTQVLPKNTLRAGRKILRIVDRRKF